MAFIKSTWFKCTTVLLAIALVAGGLLAVLNDVLWVSPEEKLERAISKLYNGEIKKIDDILLDADSTDTSVNKTPIENEYGLIDKIYIINGNKEGNFDIIFQAHGEEGFKGGVTLWIKAQVTDSNIAKAKIDKIVLSGYDGETLMSKFDNNFFDGVKDLYNKNIGKFFTVNKKETDKILNVQTGATKTSNACANAVNSVIEHLKTMQYGGNN